MLIAQRAAIRPLYLSLSLCIWLTETSYASKAPTAAYLSTPSSNTYINTSAVKPAKPAASEERKSRKSSKLKTTDEPPKTETAADVEAAFDDIDAIMADSGLK